MPYAYIGHIGDIILLFYTCIGRIRKPPPLSQTKTTKTKTVKGAHVPSIIILRRNKYKSRQEQPVSRWMII